MLHTLCLYSKFTYCSHYGKRDICLNETFLLLFFFSNGTESCWLCRWKLMWFLSMWCVCMLGASCMFNVYIIITCICVQQHHYIIVQHRMSYQPPHTCWCSFRFGSVLYQEQFIWDWGVFTPIALGFYVFTLLSKAREMVRSMSQEKSRLNPTNKCFIVHGCVHNLLFLLVVRIWNRFFWK